MAGKHRVKAHGTITAAYIGDRPIKCHSLEVKGDLHTSVLAAEQVQARRIIGGHMIVGSRVLVDELGSVADVTTQVQVG